MGRGLGPASTGKPRGDLLRPHEPHPGTTVRVKEGHWKSKYDGMRGTVERRGGHTRLWTCASRTGGWSFSASTSWTRPKPGRAARTARHGNPTVVGLPPRGLRLAYGWTSAALRSRPVRAASAANGGPLRGCSARQAACPSRTPCRAGCAPASPTSRDGRGPRTAGCRPIAGSRPCSGTPLRKKGLAVLAAGPRLCRVDVCRLHDQGGRLLPFHCVYLAG